MSEAPPKTVETQPAPAPWLAGRAGTTGSQPWALDPIRDSAILWARRDNVSRVERMQYATLIMSAQIMVPAAVLGANAFALLGLITLFGNAFSGTTGGMLSRYMIGGILTLTGFVVVATLFFLARATLYLSHLIRVIGSHSQTLLSYEWLVTSDGIHDQSTAPNRIGVSRSFYAWRDMGKPRLAPKGNLFIPRKHSFVGGGFYLPSTAFVDADAAKRFHTTLVALWKAKGNPDALSNAARREFALGETE